MEEIRNRDDVFVLVSTFYRTIQKDELLGPIFNSHIPENNWPMHLEKLTDFWVTALFGQACFKGNPGQVHKNVDKNLNHSITQVHFGKWLELWFTTIDALYEGELAQRAKDAARKMATSQYLTIWKSRP
ncbi:group III truncated hemoglobin [Aquimarina sp. AD10]|uniref:Globin n=1 Tax=Aquimarina aggregata TaxID=1642818 RepID=A0A163CZV6_9FLAO|nr:MULTISPECIES: group III truncated hemoglobin [Aquimarina]AXT62703.1 group III truncated hemoglobin [Aquimarina sp. AD10]KZS42889.1 globin [Aquimarina aggregata]RKN01886.1 group III truncated hemoglobin [Aquimarina sp. AD10]